MYKILRSFLFLFSPERAHYLTATLLHFSLKLPGFKYLIRQFYFVNSNNLERSVFGLTVTPLPQNGNPKPRLFRLKSDNAIINRMGFNNGGIEAVIKNLKNRKTDIIIGGNIGKNKVTSNENAVSDYLK